MYARFGPTEFEDFFGNLTKLRQTTSVRDYQTQFEKLLTRAEKLTPAQQVGCFISGLRESIRVEVQAARPSSLTTAVGLARLYEAKVTTKRLPIMETRRTVPPSLEGSRPAFPSIKKFTRPRSKKDAMYARSCSYWKQVTPKRVQPWTPLLKLKMMLTWR